MNSVAVPSVCLRIGSLIVATVAGVVIVIALWLVRGILATGGRLAFSWWRMFDFLPLTIVVGSLIAIPFCLMIGLPLWHLAVGSGRQSRRDALRLGLIVGAIIGLAMAVFGVNDGAWYDEPLDFLGYCLAGRCAGFIAHRAAYPPD
ncbi:hypothetical protein [Sphingomonas sp. Leaf42]|uniref:hypothetical protein n=1 Tax=Sphingomonas sp. Leaf42 TaxID=1736219 RepID=UPI000AD42918|nr:hypothetical protein [Sphingomonas sp. Leaf42]